MKSLILLLLFLWTLELRAIVDVQMDWVAVPGTEWYPGDSLLMGYGLHNAGGDPCPGFNVRFYASTDTAITAADHDLGVLPGGVLAGGQSFSDAGLVTLPLDLPAGLYYVGALATAVGDTITSNNGGYDTDSIQVIGNSDLSAVVIHSPNTPMYPGRDFQVALETRNLGSGDCPGFTATFVASRDTVMTKQDYIIGIHNYGPLASGVADGGATFVNVRLPTGIPADESYHIGAIIEYEHDLNPANNTAYDSSPVFVEPRPDLRAVSVEVATGVYLPGERIEFHGTVRNDGAVLCSGYDFDWYLSTDEIITSSDLLLARLEGGSMAPGGQHVYHTSFPISEDIPRGDYFVGIIATCPADPVVFNNDVASPSPVTMAGEGPRIVRVERVHPAIIEISWTAPMGRTYSLMRSDTLEDRFPTQVHGGLSPGPGVNTLPLPIVGERRFFRFEAEPLAAMPGP